jgi:hypothetical protein
LKGHKGVFSKYAIYPFIDIEAGDLNWAPKHTRRFFTFTEQPTVGSGRHRKAKTNNDWSWLALGRVQLKVSLTDDRSESDGLSFHIHARNYITVSKCPASERLRKCLGLIRRLAESSRNTAFHLSSNKPPGGKVELGQNPTFQAVP